MPWHCCGKHDPIREIGSGLLMRVSMGWCLRITAARNDGVSEEIIAQIASTATCQRHQHVARLSLLSLTKIPGPSPSVRSAPPGPSGSGPASATRRTGVQWRRNGPIHNKPQPKAIVKTSQRPDKLLQPKLASSSSRTPQVESYSRVEVPK